MNSTTLKKRHYCQFLAFSTIKISGASIKSSLVLFKGFNRYTLLFRTLTETTKPRSQDKQVFQKHRSSKLIGLSRIRRENAIIVRRSLKKLLQKLSFWNLNDFIQPLFMAHNKFGVCGKPALSASFGIFNLLGFRLKFQKRRRLNKKCLKDENSLISHQHLDTCKATTSYGET